SFPTRRSSDFGVGGVTVTPPLIFTYDGYTFTKGKTVHLNGNQALAYSRMRYDDPKGDYGRQLRQREVIMSVLEHALSFNTLKNLDRSEEHTSELQSRLDL